MGTDEYERRHPHEPSIPPALDDEGRCLVCGLGVRAERAERDLAAARARIEELEGALGELLYLWDSYVEEFCPGFNDDGVDRARTAVLLRDAPATEEGTDG